MKRRYRFLSGALLALILASGLPAASRAEEIKTKTVQAEYLGVAGYGAEETNKDNIDQFLYRFFYGGEEHILAIDNHVTDEQGVPVYPIQNTLKEHYFYTIEITGDMVTAAVELPPAGDEESDREEPSDALQPVPGERTLKNFLATALEPAGRALYIYGGGWDWQDEGAGPQTRSIGVSPDWERFFAEQDANYTYKDVNNDEALRDPAHSYYPFGRFNEYYYAGLDCSGYVGWTVYNTMQTKSGEPGYVGKAIDFAGKLAGYGWGAFADELVNENGLALRPGDIVSNRGHVWISLGTCSDGSALIIHSFQSPSRTGQPGGGVQLTALAWTEDCEAMRLARRYMAEYCPEWYERYEVCLRSPDVYLNFDDPEKAGCFRWNLTGENGGLTDPDGFAQLSAEEVLKNFWAIRAKIRP